MNRLNALYNLSLPIDISKYIFTFLSGYCKKCLSLTDEINLYNNCIVYKYYNIFNDNYFFPREMEEYKYLCNVCKNKFSVTKGDSVDKNDNIKYIYLIDYSVDN